ncbi:amino acid--tRNA ligase-related protein [Actinosynnema sp. NPDC059797]
MDTPTADAATPLPANPREHLSSPTTRAVLRVQHTMLDAAREHLRDRGFTEMLPPIIGPVTDPGARGFYDKESREHPGHLRNFDLLAPEGYGELCSGSEREHEYGAIIARMRETGENPAKYGWYLKMVREGIPGSAGFGIGLERLTRYVTGLEHVWQASAYPKVPGVVSP